MEMFFRRYSHVIWLTVVAKCNITYHFQRAVTS